MNTLGITVNTDTAVSSQYAGFDFNSACVFNGVVLFAGDSGIVTNTGSLDNATKISSSFQIASTDLGIKHQKKLRRLYITGTFEKKLQVTAIFDDTSTAVYTVDCPPTLGETQVDLNINSDDRGGLVGLDVANVDGGDFSIDVIEAIITLSGLKSKGRGVIGRGRVVFPSLDGDASAS